MLCAILTGPTLADVEQQLQEALPYAEVVELRLDKLSEQNLTKLKAICERSELPFLFTLRKSSQGGSFQGSEEARLQQVKAYLKLKPSYFDLEGDFASEFLIQQNPEVSFILSAHYFEKGPPPLAEILNNLDGGAYAKIAVHVSSSKEALELLVFAKDHPGTILIGMGIKGQITRILGPIFGVPFTYAPMDQNSCTAPGQLSLQTLYAQYRVHTFTSSTRVYGLMGDPIAKSISDFTHNALLSRLGRDAVYVKIPVSLLEIGECLRLSLLLGFKGLSITTPLKEAVIPFLEKIDPYAQKIGAVNTLVRKGNAFIGYNTDGPGALNAIEAHLESSATNIVVLGAGGAARAIAYEAVRRGAKVTLANRSIDKGQAAAEKIGCAFTTLNQLPNYDLIINATSAELPIAADQFISGKWAMDIASRPKVTPFLAAAAEKGSALIYGYEMFVEQAVLQFKLWGFSHEEFIQTCLFEEAEHFQAQPHAADWLK